MKSHTIRSRSAIALAATSLLLALGGCSTAATPSGGDEGESQSASSWEGVGVNDAARELLPASIRDAGVLNVGFNAPSPPYWFVSTSGATTYSGVEYELVQSIGKALGLEINLTNNAWDSLMPGLAANRYDMILSNIADKPARRDNIDFVDYASSKTQLLVKAENAGNYQTDKDACGTTVGVQTGASQIDLVQALSDKACAGTEPITIKQLGDLKGLFPALLSGQIDSIALNIAAAKYWSTTEAGQGEKYELVLDNIQVTPILYGIGVNKQNPELAAAIQATLEGLKDSGVYQDIWAGADISELTISDFTINGGQ